MSPHARSLISALADQLVRFLALAAGLALSLSACSSSGEDTGQELGAATEETVTSTTSTVSTTTTTEATTTTLSELQTAEAKVEQVVIDWWTFPLDTSVEGSTEHRLEYLTGLQRGRSSEFIAEITADGLIYLIPETPPIQVTEVRVDLDEGTAQVTACEGSTGTLVDAETLEIVQADSPDNTAVSTFRMELSGSEWKINDYLPTSITDNPIPCEINP